MSVPGTTQRRIIEVARRLLRCHHLLQVAIVTILRLVPEEVTKDLLVIGRAIHKSKLYRIILMNRVCRRRSQSPPPRSGGSSYRSGMYTNEHGPDTTAYPPASAPTSGTNYTGNGYSAAAVGAPPRGGGSARDRDYSSRTIAEPSGYPRRA